MLGVRPGIRMAKSSCVNERGRTHYAVGDRMLRRGALFAPVIRSVAGLLPVAHWPG